MRVSLWIRETAANGKRRYVKPNRKKNYPEDTVYCLRYAAEGKRRWDTLCVISLTSALAARATKEAALLSATPAVASAPPKRINVNDAMATYLSTVGATRAHKTWLAYNLILNEFRKTCAKEYLDQIDKSDLTAFVVAQKKEGQDVGCDKGGSGTPRRKAIAEPPVKWPDIVSLILAHDPRS
jgi:hypothetical protein